MKLVKKCLLEFNNKYTNKITKKEVNNDTEIRFTLLDMQKFAKEYYKRKLTINYIKIDKIITDNSKVNINLLKENETLRNLLKLEKEKVKKLEKQLSKKLT